MTGRAAIYARVSTDAQDADDKTSISEQVSDMEAYCAERGLTITARYSEVGRGSTAKRAEFQRMLADARLGRFDVIVAWKIDRLSRGMFPAAALMEVVEAHGVQLEAVMDSIDMKTFGLMAAIGKMEIDNFRERSRLGKRGAAKRGRIPTNRPPFGYRVGADGRPEIDEFQASIMRRIFQMALDGLGGTRIADRLNAEAVPTPRGGSRWHRGSVQRLLADETYCGTWWYGRRRTRNTENGVVVRRTSKEEQVGVSVPPIIDRETWETIRRSNLQRRRQAGGTPRHFYLLSGTGLRCSECGTSMSGLTRNGGRYRYYICSGSNVYGFRCRERLHIRADRLEGVIWAEVEDWLTDPEAFYKAVDSDDRADALADDIAHAEGELGKVTAEDDRAIRLYTLGKIDEAQLDRQRRFITERWEAAEERLEGLRAQQTAEQERAAMVDSITAWAKRIRSGLADLDDEARREVLRLSLDGVTVDAAGKVRIDFAVPVEPVEPVEPFWGSASKTVYWRPEGCPTV